MNEIKLLQMRARITGLEANILGMRADNYERERHGYAMAWDGDMCFEVERDLGVIEEELQQMIKEATHAEH
jgi:hypothetical protein